MSGDVCSSPDIAAIDAPIPGSARPLPGEEAPFCDPEILFGDLAARPAREQVAHLGAHGQFLEAV